MKIYYMMGFATTYVVSFLIFYYTYKILHIEKLISNKTSIRISIFLISTLLNGMAFYIIDSLNIIKMYQMLIKGLTFGQIIAFIIFIMPRSKQQS